MAGKTVPGGLKFLSVLYYIGGALDIIFGILFLFGAGFVGSIVSQIPFFAALGGGFLALTAVLGIVFILLGVLGIFVGRGLWKLQNWARIVALIFAVLGVLMALSSLFQGGVVGGIFWLIIHGLIGWYLGFNKPVKALFA